MTEYIDILFAVFLTTAVVGLLIVMVGMVLAIRRDLVRKSGRCDEDVPSPGRGSTGPVHQ